MLITGHFSRFGQDGARWAYAVFLVAAALVAARLLAHWLTGTLSETVLHPGYLLPVSSGPFIASITASALRLPEVAAAAFAVGGSVLAGLRDGHPRQPGHQQSAAATGPAHPHRPDHPARRRRQRLARRARGPPGRGRLRVLRHPLLHPRPGRVPASDPPRAVLPHGAVGLHLSGGRHHQLPGALVVRGGRTAPGGRGLGAAGGGERCVPPPGCRDARPRRSALAPAVRSSTEPSMSRLPQPQIRGEMRFQSRICAMFGLSAWHVRLPGMGVRVTLLQEVVARE